MRLPLRPELEAIAIHAGTIALGHFRQVQAERKADRTLVTAADRAVEAHLAATLTAAFPDVGLLGEEGTVRTGTRGHRFVIDPIDGTSAFVAGLPTWCVCLGLMRDAEPLAGVVHFPCTGETYSASEGRAWWNGTPLPPLGPEPTGGDPFVLVDAGAHRRLQLRYRGKVRSLGSTAYHMVLVARGVAEGALLGPAHLWDLAAPGAVLAAVGGQMEYLSGAAVDLLALADGRRAPEHLLVAAPARLATLRPLLGGA
jgi:myo-inositol-1(or 4)-monophosphatase